VKQRTEQRDQARVKGKEDVLTLLRLHRDRFRSLGVRRLGLFGSFVRGEQRHTSDVDILVEFEPGHKTFDNFSNLAFALEELLGRRVELVTPEGLSPHLRPHILREVLYVSVVD